MLNPRVKHTLTLSPDVTSGYPTSEIVGEKGSQVSSVSEGHNKYGRKSNACQVLQNISFRSSRSQIRGSTSIFLEVDNQRQ